MENAEWLGWRGANFWARITVNVHPVQNIGINKVTNEICRNGQWVKEVKCQVSYGEASGVCGYQIGEAVGIGEQPWRESGGDITDLFDNRGFIDQTKFQQKVDELTKSVWQNYLKEQR